MVITTVDMKVDGSRATVTLSTETGVNVLSTSVMHRLEEACEKIRSMNSIRTTVIRAEGKVFVAGANIKEMAGFGWKEAHEYGIMGQRTFDALAALPCVTVAAINGAALGGGLELALACDFRIAVKSAKVGLPEATLGLVPGWGGIPRLMKLIGPAHARRMFLSAAPVSAEEGHRLGLIDEIVNSVEDLGPRVTAFCHSFRQAAPSAIALAKRALLDSDDLGAFADCFSTDESREGMAAFIEKRTASWVES